MGTTRLMVVTIGVLATAAVSLNLPYAHADSRSCADWITDALQANDDADAAGIPAATRKAYDKLAVGHEVKAISVCSVEFPASVTDLRRALSQSQRQVERGHTHHRKLDVDTRLSIALTRTYTTNAAIVRGVAETVALVTTAAYDSPAKAKAFREGAAAQARNSVAHSVCKTVTTIGGAKYVESHSQLTDCS